MLQQDNALAERITATVKDIEARTSAELVVVVAARSDAYAEAAWIGGAALGWLTLAFLVWSPVPFEASWWPLDVGMVGGLGGWFVSRGRHLRRWLTPAARRAARVAEAARSAFVEEAVQGTRAHTGVLVYVSVLEEAVVLLPDEALLGRIPRARWNEVHLDARDADRLERSLRALGDKLATWLPPVEGDNPDEIADAPRFR